MAETGWGHYLPYDRGIYDRCHYFAYDRGIPWFGGGTEDGSENGSGSRLRGHYFPEYRALFAGVV